MVHSGGYWGGSGGSSRTIGHHIRFYTETRPRGPLQLFQKITANSNCLEKCST